MRSWTSSGWTHHSVKCSKRVEIATAPFQHALSTRIGCECIAHVVQTLTGIHEEATVVSIDGVGAYDLISRNVASSAGDQRWGPDHAFRQTILWTTINTLVGRRDGRDPRECSGQGDPLMPLLFSLGQHAALATANARLQDGERLFA